MRGGWPDKLSPVDAVLWGFRLVVLVLVVWGTIGTVLAAKYSGEVWLDFLVFGLSQGSIYALIALGYTMVYGILRMINFAHGEVFMAGAYTAYFVADALARSGHLDRYPLPSLLLVLAVSMTTSTLVGVLLERVAYRPLRHAPRLVPLIAAIGASFFLQYAFRGLYGSGFKAYPEPDILKGVWTFAGVRILKTQAVVLVAAVIMMLGLYAFVMKTKTGTAMRAVAEDLEAAALMGINVDRIIVTTFAVGAAMAGAAGLLYALVFKQVHFFMGFVPGIKAFTAAVLGGIGNIPGAMLGGLFLGLVESVGPILFLDGLGIVAPYQLKDVIAFTMLVMVLIFRPSGLLGERLAVKKA
ncbi:MAG: branched-chain amino acid ABC transporter permease [Candidatus Rokubacteria bacterium]|nr:branched-chain amino acid ABC transporter permease [Candidatus Rokubacteria bacterium]